MRHEGSSENQATDARTNQAVSICHLGARNGEGLALLRAHWAQLPSIPKILAGRDQGLDNSWPGFDVRTLLVGEESSGRFSFHDIILDPGSQLPAHHHAHSDSFWFVVDGEVEIRVGAATAVLHREGFSYIPEGTTTAVANLSSQPARIFVGYSPAGADRAFSSAHALYRHNPESAPADYLQALTQHGFVFHGDRVLPNDRGVNQPVPRLDADVQSFADFIDLRHRWSLQPAAAKIVTDSRLCPDIAVPDQDTKVMLSGDESSGRASVFMGGVAPQFGAPVHHQPSEEEIFYVMDGQLQLTVGSKTHDVTKGAFGFAPRYATHAFLNVQATQTRLVTINSPGGHERGFETAVREHASPHLPALLAAHGFQFHG